jgi:hypothetical protein
VAQPNDTEGTAGTEDGGDNELIRNLRAELAEAKSTNKELTEFKVNATEQAEAARSTAAEAIVNTLGFPGLKDDVLGWIEGDVTADAVTEALQARGLLGELLPEGEPPPGVENEGTPPPTQSTSQLGQAVAEAAQGGPVKDSDARLAAATTVAEVNAVMSELGATRDYSSG